MFTEKILQEIVSEVHSVDGDLPVITVLRMAKDEQTMQGTTFIVDKIDRCNFF